MIRSTMAALLALAVLGGTSDAKERQDVAESPESIRPLLIGARAPDLVLTTGDGKPFNLNEALGRKPTVLILYRGGW